MGCCERGPETTLYETLFRLMPRIEDQNLLKQTRKVLRAVRATFQRGSSDEEGCDEKMQEKKHKKQEDLLDLLNVDCDDEVLDAVHELLMHRDLLKGQLQDSEKSISFWKQKYQSCVAALSALTLVMQQNHPEEFTEKTWSGLVNQEGNFRKNLRKKLDN